MPLRVFISYRHTSDELRDKVASFAQRLRQAGFESQIDQYVQGSPSGGWTTWMEREIGLAEIIVVVCTAAYQRSYDQESSDKGGRGSAYEARLVRQEIYNKEPGKARVIPVLFDDEPESSIVKVLQDDTCHRLPEDFEQLCRHLRLEPGVTPAPIASRSELRGLPPVNAHYPTTKFSRSKSPRKFIAITLGAALITAAALVGTTLVGNGVSSTSTQTLLGNAPSGSATPSLQRSPEPSPLAPEEQSAETLKLKQLHLASWNLRELELPSSNHAQSRSVENLTTLAKYAARLNADVIAVQEVASEEALRRVFPQSSYDILLSKRKQAMHTGFVYRRGLRVTNHPDLAALNTHGSLREGTDITVEHGDLKLRLLSIHLKAFCKDASLEASTGPCATLSDQLDIVGTWVEKRANEAVPFAVLGDFNRTFAVDEKTGWKKLTDDLPTHGSLWSPTRTQKTKCWGRYSGFIDHLVLDERARAFALDGSFSELVYDPSDESLGDRLSDHCPISIRLQTTQVPKGSSNTPPEAKSQRVRVTKKRATPAKTNARKKGPRGAARIKGNINRSAREKIYHLPGCRDYDETIISQPGEQWFVTEKDAIKAGFRKAKTCPKIRP